MSTTSTPYWTEPRVADQTGCTAAEFEEIDHIITLSSTTGRESRDARIAVGDWLLAKYGPSPKAGSRYGTESQLDELADRLHKSVHTLRKWRLVAHRWRQERRPPVFDSPVYVSFTLLHQVALSSEQGSFDQEEFDAKVQVLLDLMTQAEQNDILEITEVDYLKAVRKAIRPSRQPAARAEHKALTTTVQHFEARSPEVRTAVLDAVKADDDAAKSVAAAYLMRRPDLARAVLREDPELVEAAAREAATHNASASHDPDGAETVFRELVQVLGGNRPSDELLLAEWREDFAKAITRINAFVTDWYPAEKVVANADDDLLKLVTYLADDVAQWAAAITNSRMPGLRLVESTTA
ncbi:hypothetical protein ACFY5K_34690 [Streptomyces griseofuscus]|uniref:hypothetical protein n=1 Tax=Streptomyces griseofuscus TaxID=146922 RepID=UPI0036BE83C8